METEADMWEGGLPIDQMPGGESKRSEKSQRKSFPPGQPIPRMDSNRGRLKGEGAEGGPEYLFGSRHQQGKGGTMNTCPTPLMGPNKGPPGMQARGAKNIRGL